MLENGWDSFEIGTVLKPFQGEATDILEIMPENRSYTKESSFSASVADWRIEKPIFHAEHCIHCQFCWIYCPDMSIISRDKKMVSIDYEHCKGCGICVEVCPTTPKSLLMFAEQKDETQAIIEWPTKEKKEEKES